MRRLLVLGTVFALVGSTALALDPVHRYSFTTGASDTGSIGGLNGTAYGGVTFDGSAHFATVNNTGDYIGFTGGNDIAAISATSKAVTIDFWGAWPGWHGDASPAYAMGTGDWNAWMTHWTGTGAHVFINTPSGNGGYDNWSDPGLYVLSGGSDIHVTDVFDGNTNTVKMYINGLLAHTGYMDTNALSGVAATKFQMGVPMSLPANWWDGWMKGSLNEFRIYGSALSALEVAAAQAAGPDALPTVVYVTSTGVTTDWNVNTTWSNNAVPTNLTSVTINGPAVTLSAPGAPGVALGLAITSGSLAITNNSLTVGAVLDTTGGPLTLGATSTLNLASADTASALKQVSGAGSTINISGSLIANAATTPAGLAGVNVAAAGVTADNGTFDTTSLASFQLTGGAVLAKNNGVFNLTQGTANTASSLLVNTNGTITVGSPTSTPATTSLTLGSGILLDGRPATLDVKNAGLTTAGILVRDGQLVVEGSAVLGTRGGDFNTGQGDYRRIAVIAKDSATIDGSGRTWRIGDGYASSTNYVRLQDGAQATFGEVSVLNWGGYNDGHGAGTVLEVADNAQLTSTGRMYVLRECNDNGRDGAHYSYAQVYQHGPSTVTVAGDLRFVENVYRSKSLAGYEAAGTYNLSGGTLNVGGRILGSAGTAGAGQAFLNFHGGSLVYTGSTDQGDFLNLGVNSPSNARVYQDAKINTGGKNLTINQALLAPTDNGLSAIALTGLTGDVYANNCPPWIYISGGGGSGATAVATLDATGHINGITVTNPGSGYTSTPTVLLVAGGAVYQTVASGDITMSANSAYTGGLTKTGDGMLTLTGANTYTGNTTISGGTLRITNPYLADTADVLFTGSSFLDLAFSATDDIRSLYFNGVPQLTGTWGATGSGATHIDDNHFTGTGLLNVTTLGVVTGGKFWNGNLSGVWNTTVANWKDASHSSGVVFINGDQVTFDNTATGTKIVDMTGPVAPASVLVQNADYELKSTSGLGKITGGASLTKSGSGTLTLSTANDYTGGTTVTGGTLLVAAANALPTGGTLTIGAGGTVVLASSLSSAAVGGSAASANVVPEPGTLALLAAAAVCGLWIARRRR